jgi:beta-galactosidase
MHMYFNAVELSSDDLDVLQTPVCWVMMEKQCNPDTQKKLVDYINRGGRLILAGRICIEDFNHRGCTILKNAIGIKQIHGDLPFVSNFINAFQYHDIPVSFLETYSGAFDEVFATRGEVVGFIKKIGGGEVMVFGAAMTTNTLDDLDIVNQMALKMNCPPLFIVSNWADVRLSRGENGSFLFINNYQDDPVETTIKYKNELLFGGNTVNIPARRGLILPLDWQLREDVMINYLTAEIVEITDAGSMITIKTSQDEFDTEITLGGYHCDHSITIEKSTGVQQIGMHSKEGVIVLRKNR